MDGDTDGDGAINLSTSQRPSAANTPNGSIEYEDSGQVSSQKWFSAFVILIKVNATAAKYILSHVLELPLLVIHAQASRLAFKCENQLANGILIYIYI